MILYSIHPLLPHEGSHKGALQMDEKKLLMVTVSGPDRPGITAALTRVLAEHRAEIVDIEQASLKDLLGLYFLLDIGSLGGSQDSVIKDLLFEASQMNLTLQFRLFGPEEVRAVNQRNLFVLTHFGGTGAMASLLKILTEEKVNIETISTADHHGARSMKMVLNTNGGPGLRSGSCSFRIQEMCPSCIYKVDFINSSFWEGRK